MSREIIFVNDSKEIIINNSILYFYINDNFIHKKIKSILFQEYNKNYNIYFINIKNFKNYIKIYDLKSVPTFIFFKDKKEKYRINNIINLKDFKLIIDDIYNF